MSQPRRPLPGDLGLADFTPEDRAALDTRLEAAAAIEESGEAVGARVAQSSVPAKE